MISTWKTARTSIVKLGSLSLLKLMSNDRNLIINFWTNTLTRKGQICGCTIQPRLDYLLMLVKLNTDGVSWLIPHSGLPVIN